MDESKLIFYTGAPGSKWSSIAHILTHNTIFPINTSDYDDHRVYTHNSINVSHLGAYWGPGNGIGEKFHNISQLSKEEILEEIDKPYKDKTWEKYRIIKCHHFSLNLNFIKDVFPKSKIIIILRPDKICYFSWLYAGGFNRITYPDYFAYYKNETILLEKIIEENAAARNFIDQHNLDIDIIRKKYFIDKWKMNDFSAELENYIFHLENKDHYKLYDTMISTYNF